MPLAIASADQIKDLRLAADPFGIYAARKALDRAGISIAVYRGDEWWNAPIRHWPGEQSRQWDYCED